VIERVLITGIGGSGASYLAEWILENHPEVEVHGFSRWHTHSKASNPGVLVHEVDLMDFSSVLRGLQKCWPSVIFHMASHANVRACFDTPLAVLNNNIMGTANLLEAWRYRHNDGKSVFVMCSTSEVYGQVDPKHVPINEDCPIRPASPYAVSKLAQDALSHTYWLNYRLPVVRTRMFSYFNPRRTDIFSSAFAKQVAEIERGERKELVHGNLDSVRTLLDIRDVCSAYWAAATCPPGEVYNIGGESTMSVGDFLEMLKTHARVPIPTKLDPRLKRPTDVTLQIPDSTKFKHRTGWSPQYKLEDSVQHLLEHYR
jgi:GDP-4-dehydro-6-deoxy-D-mannose reductase